MFISSLRNKRKNLPYAFYRNSAKSLIFSQKPSNDYNTGKIGQKRRSVVFCPFMDDNTLKARRRLRHSTLPETAKYPIILNAKEPAARLLLEHAHCRCMHLGTEYVRNYLQQKFLIIGLRQALKQIRHRCFFCRRLQGKGLSVFRSDLPSTRFQDPNENPYPFKTVGIDYIGPFHIAENSSTTKQYI